MKPVKPIYELTVDDRFQYLITFRGEEHKSREEEVVNFLYPRFTKMPEYQLKTVRPKEYGKIGIRGWGAFQRAVVEELVTKRFGRQMPSYIEFLSDIKSQEKLESS